jgi:hypothetical protein
MSTTTPHPKPDTPVQVATYDSPVPVPPGSSYIDAEIQSSHDRSGSVMVRQARPLPARLLSVAGAVMLGDAN